MANQPTSFRLPFNFSEDVHPQVRDAFRLLFQGTKDLNDAIVAIKPKLGQTTTTQAVAQSTTIITGGGGGGSVVSIGNVNQQVGPTYTLQQTDYGTMVILESTGTFALSLNSLIAAPYFTVINNQSVGVATLTPTSGLINNAASWSIPVGQFALVFFDGFNWWATQVFAQTFTKIPKEWIDSYNAITGLFTASQPRASDLIDSTVGSGPVVLDSGATLINPTIRDSAGSLGTSGQLLSATGSGVLWIASSGAGPNFADAETPSGTVDGFNKVFTLAHSPSPAGSLELFNNGVLQHAGGADYTLSGNTITFVLAPVLGATLLAWYRF